MKANTLILGIVAGLQVVIVVILCCPSPSNVQPDEEFHIANLMSHLARASSQASSMSLTQMPEARQALRQSYEQTVSDGKKEIVLLRQIEQSHPDRLATIEDIEKITDKGNDIMHMMMDSLQDKSGEHMGRMITMMMGMRGANKVSEALCNKFEALQALESHNLDNQKSNNHWLISAASALSILLLGFLAMKDATKKN